MFYSYENIYISEVTLLLKGAPPPIAWGIASVFYLLAICSLFCFSYNRQITLVCDVGAELLSKQAGWIIELNFSLKLLCFVLSQVLKLLILKYYFHTKDKKCPTATLSGQDEANLAF